MKMETMEWNFILCSRNLNNEMEMLRALNKKILIYREFLKEPNACFHFKS